MLNCPLRLAADRFAYCYSILWYPPQYLALLTATAGYRYLNRVDSSIGLLLLMSSKPSASRLVICLCTMHLTALSGSCALGRRLSPPTVVPRPFIYHWNCSFSNNVSSRYGYFIDTQSLGPLSLVMAPSTPFYKIFGTSFFWMLVLSLQGDLRRRTPNLFLFSISFYICLRFVSLPRALGCLVYWSTDHFMILGFSIIPGPSGLHGHQDLYNHYEPSCLSVSASRPWLPGLLVN